MVLFMAADTSSKPPAEAKIDVIVEVPPEIPLDLVEMYVEEIIIAISRRYGPIRVIVRRQAPKR